MARRRISDLLQEEAQKYSPTDTEAVIEVSAQSVVETETTPNTSSTDVEPETETPPTTDTTTSKRTTSTKADLETAIASLKHNLEESQQNEVNLRQEITDLQTALSEKTAFVEQLQKELWEAKKAALQLAESNTSLIEEIKTLKQEPPKAIVKQVPPTQEPPKQNTQPVNYRKSHYHLEPTPQKPITPSPDFADTMWLLD